METNVLLLNLLYSKGGESKAAAYQTGNIPCHFKKQADIRVQFCFSSVLQFSSSLEAGRIRVQFGS